MAVPNTTTFTMLDVKANVAGSPNTLQQAFTNSTDSLFDPAYKGSKDNLLNFRNYGASMPPENYLEVSPTVINDLDGTAGVYFFDISSNAPWLATKDAGGSWLNSPINEDTGDGTGTGSGTVGMLKAANTTSGNRGGTLKVVTTGGSPNITRYVSITQYPRD